MLILFALRNASPSSRAAIANDESLQRCTKHDTHTVEVVVEVRNGWKGDMSKVSLAEEVAKVINQVLGVFLIMKFWFMSPPFTFKVIALKLPQVFFIALQKANSVACNRSAFFLDTNLIINHVYVRLWKLPRLWKETLNSHYGGTFQAIFTSIHRSSTTCVRKSTDNL